MTDPVTSLEADGAAGAHDALDGVEVTDEMRDAGEAAYLNYYLDVGSASHMVDTIYRAMSRATETGNFGRVQA